MLGRTDSRRRMVAILLVFAIFASATGVGLAYWQVVAASELQAMIYRPSPVSAAESTVRADIVDRAGKTLALTASYDSLEAHPDLVGPDRAEAVVDTLDDVLGLDAGERERFVAALADRKSKHKVLRARLTFEESKAVASVLDGGSLRGIVLTPHPTRQYIKGGQSGTTLAAHVLGFVRADGRGGEGIERAYDERLTTADPDSLDLASIEGVPGSLADYRPAELQLTIDAGLQKQVEKELNTVRIANQAKSVSAVVMDPRSGAILAAASVPSYDANEFAAIASADISLLRNRVFSDQYEPGSVMKIFTATAALDLGLITPTTVIQDQRALRFGNHTVRNADKSSKGGLKVKDVIALSRNVATAKIAKRLAPHSTQTAARRLYDLWEKVGMTGPTGADIASEAQGTWHDPDDGDWMPVDLANRAFGQGVAVTLPQLARGFSTLVNGGHVVQPHIVAEGRAAGVKPRPVLKAKVARQAQDILVHVTGSVTRYAQGSLIPGYMIGGKTGTAQIWDVSEGRFKKRRFNHSFVGFVGGKRPDVVIAVRIEEPKPIYVKQGSIPLYIESYGLFQMVARASIKHLDIKRSKDPNAGRPIIGTAAAASLDPERNREALRDAKRKAKQHERREAKAAKATTAGIPAQREGDDTDPASRDGTESGSP
jgi:stage V sporulation protein D (sporulation-specific penicillin-binding protein)